MNTKHCRICGQTKPTVDFTTAYKDTCKDCRNRQLREERALLKQLSGGREAKTFPKKDWEDRLFQASVSIHTARIAANTKNAEPGVVKSVQIAEELINELLKKTLL